MYSGGGAPEVRRIAVLRPNQRLGNTLLLTPLVQELEQQFPGAHIELVTACGMAPSLLQGFAQVSTAHTFPTHSYRHPGRVLSTLWALRRCTFDLAIDPIPRSRAGRFLLHYVRARDRLGFRWGVPIRDSMLTHAADPAGAPAHFAQAPLYLLRSAYLTRLASAAAGMADANAGMADAKLPLDLRLTDSERRDGEQRLAATLGGADWRARPRLGIFAHATGQKGYPIEWWRQLVAYFRRQAPAVQLVEFVPEDGRPRLAGEVRGVHTPDLRLLGATLAATSLVVIADGGVMHLAEAAGARVLGLFKATEPSRYGPFRGRSEALWARDVSAESVAERISTLLNATADTAAAGSGAR